MSRPAEQMPVESQPAEVDNWLELPERQRAAALKRKRFLDLIYAVHSERGVSINVAADNVRATAAQRPDSRAAAYGREIGRNGKLPAKQTIYRWHERYAKHGMAGLIDNYKGSQRTVWGWEARAIKLYREASNPSKQGVAGQLRREGFESALNHRVRAYLDSLPQSQLLKGRMGPIAFENGQKGYVRRERPPVGCVYQGDGHRLDIYLEHPNGKKVWRPELTLWLDVGSACVVGFWINEDEATHSTIFALSTALESHDHIPDFIHIDNGSGYKNKVMSDPNLGLYEGLGISVMHARPYNAKAKGHVERFFGTMERSLNKFLPGYCGPDMADEAGQALMRAHRKGEFQPLTLRQWAEEFKAWLNWYHNEPHDGLDGATPAEKWAELKRFPIRPEGAARLWPKREVHVRRSSVTLDKRVYEDAALVNFNGQKLVAEYSIHDDSTIRVITREGEWICDAQKAQAAPYLPASRIDEARQKKLAKQIQRLEVHADEKRQRANLALTQADTLAGVEALSDDTPDESMTHDPAPEFDLLGPLLAADEESEASPARPASRIPDASEASEDPWNQGG